MLRDYQAAALAEVSRLYAAGTKKVLLHLATGGGKTATFCEAIQKCYANDSHAIVVVKGRKLVDQASKRLFRENVPHGVLMAGHWNFRPRERVQVCSIDTLIAMRKRAVPAAWPQADLVVIDECHMALSPGYVEFAEHYKDSYFLSVSATPYVPKSLRHIADAVVKPITTQELIDKDYLVDAEYYVPGAPDLSNVRHVNGDYHSGDLEEVMSERNLVGDAVDQWRKIAEGKRSLYFCVSVAHSKQVAASFRSAGISAEHCDAETKECERERIIQRLERGETRVITNVGIFCTGVDIPPVECIGMLRPTESMNLYLQQAGRGTRPFDGKDRFLLIDHAGNVKKHGKITEEYDVNLDGKIKKYLAAKQVQVCPACFAGFYGTVCPHCERELAVGERVREIIQVEGELVKLETESPEQYWLRRYERERKMKGYKKGWVFHRMKEQFGEEVALKFCPQKTFFWGS